MGAGARLRLGSPGCLRRVHPPCSGAPRPPCRLRHRARRLTGEVAPWPRPAAGIGYAEASRSRTCAAVRSKQGPSAARRGLMFSFSQGPSGLFSGVAARKPNVKIGSLLR
jgi:hypothetical protein